jgi:hypothetical protein
MKNLMYLLVAGTMFIFTACICGDGNATATDSAEEVVACADDCKKACCLGCHATEGDAVCLADHSCCAAHEEVTEEAHDHGVEGHSHE